MLLLLLEPDGVDEVLVILLDVVNGVPVDVTRVLLVEGVPLLEGALVVHHKLELPLEVVRLVEVDQEPVSVELVDEPTVTVVLQL